MTEGKPTPGPWRTYDDNSQPALGGLHVATEKHGHICSCETQEDAAFIAEAGTVFHETGLTPRQLADALDVKNAEVAELGAYITAAWRAFGGPQITTYEEAEELTYIAELIAQRDRAEAKLVESEKQKAELVEALTPFAQVASCIPNSAPDETWTSCESWPLFLSDQDVKMLEAQGLELLSRESKLLLWIDGISFAEFRRARTAIANARAAAETTENAKS